MATDDDATMSRVDKDAVPSAFALRETIGQLPPGRIVVDDVCVVALGESKPGDIACECPIRDAVVAVCQAAVLDGESEAFLRIGFRRMVADAGAVAEIHQTPVASDRTLNLSPSLVRPT